MAPVSLKKEISLSATTVVPQGSVLVMYVCGALSGPGQLQSSVPSPKRWGSLKPDPEGCLAGLAEVQPGRPRLQSDFRWPSLPYLGQGPGGGLGFEQDLALCPSLLHLKHGPGGGLAPDLPTVGGPALRLGFMRAMARSWKAS